MRYRGMKDRGSQGFLQSRQRPLTAAEARALRSRMMSWGRRGRRTSAGSVWIAAAVIALLWVMTLLASDASVLVVTIFWLVVGAGMAVWVRRDARADQRQLAALSGHFDSALRRNLADVYDVHATAFVEFEEIEDEGACYAFQLDGDRVVFVQGQEFYESARFPSLDFSLVLPLDDTGRPVDMLIEKRAPKTTPLRVVPADVKRTLLMPEHLEVRHGHLDTVETLLARSDAL